MHTRVRCRWRRWLCVLGCMLAPGMAVAQEFDEYRIKAAFLFNFAAFIEWPASVGATLDFCVYGKDPFGVELDRLAGRRIGARVVQVRRPQAPSELRACRVLFVDASASPQLPRIADMLRGQAVAIVTDVGRGERRGAALQLAVEQDHVVFDADLAAARALGLTLGSKLLRLAREVYP